MGIPREHSWLKRFALLFLMVAINVSCVSETTKNGKPYNIKKDEKVNMEQALSDYAALANAYMAQGDRENALRAINKGLAIKDDSPEILNVLAFYYDSDGEAVLAEKEFLHAISADRSYTASYMNYGAFLFAHQKYPLACEMLAKAASDVMYAKRGEAFTSLGQCYKKLGRNDDAEDAFLRSLKHDFKSWRPLLEMSAIKFESGNFIESQKYYDEFLKYGKQSPKSLWLGIRLAHIADDKDKKASYGLYLKNQFPQSKECAEYQAWESSN